jgi:diguanylate cyclase (GGDEF)-like protein
MLRFILSILLLSSSLLAQTSSKIDISYISLQNKNSSIQKILQKDADKLFKPLQKTHTKFGFNNKVFWIKADIKNTSSKVNTMILELEHPSLDYIDIYQKISHTLILKKKLGDLRPYDSSMFIPNPSYKFNLKPHERKIFFIKIKTQGTMNIGINIQDRDTYIRASNTQIRWLTFYIGAVFIMILYNFIIFIIIKNISFLFYVLFHAFYLLFTLTLAGITFELLWPNNPEINLYIIPISIPLVGIFSILFFITFLNIKTYAYKLYLFLLFSIIACIITLLSVFIFNYHSILIVESILSFMIAITLFIGSISLYLYKKNINALLYFIAWNFTTLGIIIAHLSNIGIIPSFFLTSFSAQIGSFFEVLLLSIALAYYYTNLKKSHDKLSNINKKLEYLSNTDILTQCYNRRYFYSHVQQLLPNISQNNFFLLMLDLDYFKKVNDTFGHEIGDKVLYAVAQICIQRIADNHIFARLGGEEFVLFVPHSNKKDITHLAKQLLHSISHIKIESVPNLTLSVSIGISQNEKHLNLLLSHADKALYYAKNAGRNTFYFYNDI